MDRQRDDLQSSFLKLRFGMFIHFNMATYLGGGWPNGYHSPSIFNPGSRIDTDAWAAAAVSAGMEYGVLTVKHASGFCLWDSKHTTYNVMHPVCPYQQDLVAQYVESFTAKGLRVGLYYCWRNPGFGDPAKYKVLPPECDPSTHPFHEQNAFQKAQIAELLDMFPDTFYLWNDGIDPEVMGSDEYLAFISELRLDVITSANWWDWNKKGTPYLDIAVTETRPFPETNTIPGETCWCLEDHWFWRQGTRPKNPREIVDQLESANSRNANFLLNVGPDRTGSLLSESVEILAEIGHMWRGNMQADNGALT